MSTLLSHFARPIVLSSAAFLVASCSSTKDIASPSGVEGSAPNSSKLADKSSGEVLEIVPGKWDVNYVFDAYKNRTNWRQKSGWARSWTREMDMSGVAWNTSKSGTLVTPRHLVMSNRVAHAVGDEVVFHDAKGNPHVRTVEAVASLGAMKVDLGMALLNEDVPVTVYKVLPSSRDYSKALPGSSVFVTDAEAKLLVAKVREVRQGHIVFEDDDRVVEHFKENLDQEDIGNPSFLRFNGEPVLLTVNSLGGPGGGVFLSDPVIYGGIESMIKALGGGHQLESVDIDSFGGEIAYAAPAGPRRKKPVNTGGALASFKFSRSAEKDVTAAPAPVAAEPAHDHSGHSHAAHAHSGHSHHDHADHGHAH